MLGRTTGGFHASFGDAKVASRNLKKLKQSFANDKATTMIASGGSSVVVVNPDIKEVKSDALITTHFSHNLVLRPADCLPLLVASSQPAMLALIHASRASLEQGIVENTLDKMISLGLKINECIVHIGPGIASKTYVLPQNIQEQLHHCSWVGNIQETKNGLAIDLAGFISSELRRLGLLSRITKSNVNTAENDKYFSHYKATRNGATNGRNGFVCEIEKIS